MVTLFLGSLKVTSYNLCDPTTSSIIMIHLWIVLKSIMLFIFSFLKEGQMGLNQEILEASVVYTEPARLSHCWAVKVIGWFPSSPKTHWLLPTELWSWLTASRPLSLSFAFDFLPLIMHLYRLKSGKERAMSHISKVRFFCVLSKK